MRRLALALPLLALAGAAAACGHCIEDRVAAVYDHAVITQAVTQKRAVAFFAIAGTIAPGEASRRALVAAAEAVPGVVRGTVRVSVDTASLSLAYDPQRASLAKVESVLSRRLETQHLTLAILRIMDAPGRLEPVARR